MVDDNSIESYRKCLEQKWTTLTAKIYDTFYRSNEPLTDRQVCEINGWLDMNIARPKINGLIKRNMLVKVDDVEDKATKRRVRRCVPSSRIQ